MNKILLIDDDEELAPLLAEYFARFNLDLSNETHPQDGLDRLEAEAFDLVILDLMLPDMDGFEVCRNIRKTNDIPVVMLTARGEVTDRIVGLELGADDYLPKPFEPRELVARIQNILKRVERQPERSEPASDGPLQIDQEHQRVMLNDEEMDLTFNEYQLLCLLASEPGKTFSRDDILHHLKGMELEIFSRSVDIAVSRLRQKLKPLDCIKTHRGLGYAFIEPDA